MLNKEIVNDIYKKISIILNEPFRYIGRASDIAWLGFGEDKISRDFHGRERVLAQYALHIQCSFRIISSDKIILANSDMFEPSKKNEEKVNFNWDSVGENLYDEKSELLTKKLEVNSFIVSDINISRYGDLKIRTSNDYVIEVFNNISYNDESWRFFEPGCDKYHLIITGQKMEI